MDYVEAVLTKSVRVYCAPGPLLTELLTLGATSSSRGVDIPFNSKHELAKLLSELQKLQFPFADAMAGWPPAAVFAELRDEGLVHGSITAVSWSSPDNPILRAA